MRIEWMGDLGVRWYIGPTSIGILYVELSVSKGKIIRRLVAHGKRGQKETLSYEVYDPKEYAVALEAAKTLVSALLGEYPCPKAMLTQIRGLVNMLENYVGGEECGEKT